MNDFAEKQNRTAERLGLAVERLPHHIAIIMDGNGRWAESKGLPRMAGHREGAKTVEKIARYCVSIGIESLTLYSFSMENWKRPQNEIEFLMYLYSRYLAEIRPTLMKDNVRLIHLGRMEQLPEQVRNELLETIKLTSANTGMVIGLALNYSGRTEIVDAVRNIARKCKEEKLSVNDINEKCISEHLYAPNLHEPDLLIRTANERRVSNFLLWQISYSEFYVTKIFWPDFTEKDLDEAIIDYSQRQRRFGDIGRSG
jgi:undecaprenyl diphosphate synthase